jgi:hypothetical protein
MDHKNGTHQNLKLRSVAYPGIFWGVGVQQIQLRTDGRENGDLGALAPYSGVPLSLQISETRILIRLVRTNL